MHNAALDKDWLIKSGLIANWLQYLRTVFWLRVPFKVWAI